MSAVTINVSDIDGAIDKLNDLFDSAADFLVEFCENEIIPQLEAQSGSQRKVHTGTYSTTWEAEEDGDDSAVITTDADYWVFLELGTARIKAKPVVRETVENIEPALRQFIIGAINEAVQE